MANSYPSEKLNLWDRFFNRYKKIAVNQGSEQWKEYHPYSGHVITTFTRNYVTYHIVDRITGGFTVKKEYLN
jgi:hypothetical protein